MTFTMAGSIVATLVASFMFALWYQSLKHLGRYPLAGFVLWLYLSSYATVWLAIAAFGKTDIPNGIGAQLAGRGWAALGVAAGGACMTWGLIISLSHMHKNGMVANQAIAGSAASLLSLALTFVVGGLGSNVSLPLVLVAAGVLVGASAVIQHSSVIKYQTKGDASSIEYPLPAAEAVESSGFSLNNKEEDATEETTSPMPDSLLKQNLVLIVSNLLFMGYSVAYMLGTKSSLHPNGFPALLCVLLLASGSLFAAVCYSAISLTRRRQWKAALMPENKLPILLGIGAGFCHYGGTVLQIYSLPLLSAPVSALLTKTSSLWTYMWGILYGEYKGCTARAKRWLASGILLFVLGIVLLTYALYF